MSCNGCRVLRKGCSETCALRTCLQWIESPEAQGHATLFLAKFFGRSDLMSFISSVPLSNRPALFQSLLFEACGRTVNPVNGAVGLLWSGNWHVCEAAVETVLAGGVPRPLPDIFAGVLTPILDESSDAILRNARNTGKSMYSPFWPFMHHPSAMNRKSDMDVVNSGRIAATLKRQRDQTTSFGSGELETTSFASSWGENKKLLNLFV